MKTVEEIKTRSIGNMMVEEFECSPPSPLTIYRTNTPPVVYPEPKPRDYGPIKRTGQISLLMLPWISMVVMTILFGPAAILPHITYMLLGILGVMWADTLGDYHTKISKACVGVYYPLLLAYGLLVKLPIRSLRYIRTGK